MHGDGPQLIVAGAGTGKTRVITARIAWLIIEKGLKVDEILALTFTEKAAEEMEERVDKMLPYGYVDLWIDTFHAFCDKVLKRHALDIGLADNYKLLDETETWLLVRKNLDKFNLDYYRPLGNPAKFIHALIKHFSRCKDEGIYPEQYLKYAEEIKMNTDAAEFIKQLDLDDLSEKEKEQMQKQEILRIEEIAGAYHTYQQILLANNSLDFADMIAWTIKLFKDRPLILQKYRQQFKYILVDEFQDTNFVQYELIKLLAFPKNNITVVGDDDQSIYRFRGSSITNILQFKDDFPDACEVVLTDNYRSCQPILDLSYEFIKQNNPCRLEEKLGIDKKLKSHKQVECQIEHIHEQTVEDESAAAVQKIIQIKNSDAEATWSDFAILVRANDSAKAFTNALESSGIPYQFLAMRGLYDKPVIVDIISYLKLLDNYHESAAVFRVLNIPFLNLTPGQIVLLAHFSKRKSISLYESLKLAAGVPGITAEALSIVNKLICQVEKHSVLAKNKKPSEILLGFMYDSGYLKYLESQDERLARENLSYVQQFYKKIQNFETDSEAPRLKDFMEMVEMEMQAGESGKLSFDVEAGPDMVRVMTIHGAKGLEFDYVFIVNLVDRKFPTDERRETIQIPDALIREKIPQGDFHLEEERRLFYVAMTRAKKGLYFTSAEDYGGARKKKLSRFLLEMGEQVTRLEPQASLREAQSVQGKQVEQMEQDKKIIYEIPKRFSFSQMQAYETCPLKYKFANILKIPTFGTHYFSFGSAIHNTLQKFLERNFQFQNTNQQNLFDSGKAEALSGIGLETLYEIYDDCWLDDWYQDEKQKQEYYKKGKELLKNFWNDFQIKKPKVKFLEQIFKLKLGGYDFSGRIDRIDEALDGKVKIIDYKTGAAKQKLSADEKNQLLLYQLAAEQSLNLKVDSLVYHYLEENETIPFLGNEKAKQKLTERFIENARQIENQNFEPSPSQHVCGFCEYRGICEFRK